MKNLIKKYLIAPALIASLMCLTLQCSFAKDSEHNPTTSEKVAEANMKDKNLLDRYEAYITKELKLNKDEAKRFFPLYRELDKKCFAIWKDLHRKMIEIESKKNPGKEEVRNYIKAMTKAKIDISNLQNQYYLKFSDIIPGQKLIRLTTLKRKFAQKYFSSIIK